MQLAVAHTFQAVLIRSWIAQPNTIWISIHYWKPTSIRCTERDADFYPSGVAENIWGNLIRAIQQFQKHTSTVFKPMAATFVVETVSLLRIIRYSERCSYDQLITMFPHCHTPRIQSCRTGQGQGHGDPKPSNSRINLAPITGPA